MAQRAIVVDDEGATGLCLDSICRGFGTVKRLNSLAEALNTLKNEPCDALMFPISMARDVGLDI
ncbi:MAG: hypothetical protein HN348_25680, partial [Proteobacteria bacterium]|nr:hypothetical protein [Pseudomonadota bacterium]